MKNLVFLLTAVIITALSSNVFGQGTYIAPEIGSVHNYSVTDNGNSYSWTVTSDVAGATSVVGTVATFVGSNASAAVQITWVNPSIGSTYYVHVTETDGNGCSNRKALAVVPVNAFELEIVSVDLSDEDTDNGQNDSICAAGVIVQSYDGSDANDFTYNYQKDSVFYKISASGINLTNTDWSPQFTISHDGYSGSTVTAGWANTIGDASFNSMSLATNGSANDIDVSSSVNSSGEIWIKVVIDNSTTHEGLTANDITVELLDGANQSEDENGNDVTDIGNGSRNQVVRARPATSDIGN
jgi:hypothetical protein